MKICLLLLALIPALGLAQPDTIKVLVWNTERGSNPYGPDGKNRVLKVVRDSGADVVLWQESYPLGKDGPKLSAWVCDQLGWKVWQGKSPHLAVASRFEQIETHFHHPWHGVGARMKDGKGREFMAWSIWLDYRASIQRASRKNPDITDEELLACEDGKSNRVNEAKALLADLKTKGHLALNVPLLVGGDWNTSSHLDWTAETSKVFSWRRPLALPVSGLMHAAGFADAFRFVNPDPVKAPGNTWTPRKTAAEDPPERIDRLYVRNPLGGNALVPVKTTVYPLNVEDARMPREEARFPSDHAAVLVELKWDLAGVKTPGAHPRK